MYHTKRMQRLTAVAWSLDNKYVISASDEMCLRVWKARASEKLAMMRDRERVALNYNEKLKEKYGQHPKVKGTLSRLTRLLVYIRNCFTPPLRRYPALPATDRCRSM